MRAAAVASLVLFLTALSYPAMSESSEKWVTSWAASAQGPYPSGNALLQPDLRRAFPAPEAGAKDQSFRLIIGPDVWGCRSPHPALQRLWYKAGYLRWRFRGAATRQLGNRPGYEPSRDIRRREERRSPTRGKRLERCHRAALYRRCSRSSISSRESSPSASMWRARAAP